MLGVTPRLAPHGCLWESWAEHLGNDEVMQSKLKDGGLIALIVVFSAVPPLSTDMLMPALPVIAERFHTTSTVTSFAVTEFFVGMALGMLFLGPLSDRFGRKPVLMASIGISTVFAVLCAFSTSIWMLLATRFVQAVGGGGMLSLGMALVKDSFDGPRMGRVLAVVTAIGTLAPMIAPVIGAGLLALAGWRCSFVVLAAMFAGTFLGVLLLDETLPMSQRTPGSIFVPISRMFSIGREVSFTFYLVVAALAMAPFMTYLAVSSFIYTGIFGTSETMFSVYFAISAAVSTLGALFYMRRGAHDFRRATTAFIVGSLGSGLLVLLVGHMSAVAFLLSYMAYATLENYFRPMATNVLLASRTGDVGAASSLINFVFTISGAIVMAIGSIQLGDYIISLAVSMLGWIALAAILWVVALRRDLLPG